MLETSMKLSLEIKFAITLRTLDLEMTIVNGQLGIVGRLHESNIERHIVKVKLQLPYMCFDPFF
jgi:hypothetical protein